MPDGVSSKKPDSPRVPGVCPDPNEPHGRSTQGNAYDHDGDTERASGSMQQEDVEATRDEEHKRQCAEKNARIEALKFEVEKTRHEDLQLHADAGQGEGKLARMKAELKRLQPQQTKEKPPEFYIRPAKVKKGKKK